MAGHAAPVIHLDNRVPDFIIIIPLTDHPLISDGHRQIPLKGADHRNGFAGFRLIFFIPGGRSSRKLLSGRDTEGWGGLASRPRLVKVH